MVPDMLIEALESMIQVPSKETSKVILELEDAA